MVSKYKSVKIEEEEKIVEKKSIFIAHIKSIDKKSDAIDYINKIKKENKTARHNVYAYILIDGTKIYSDDGEPKGTAGKPILEVLEKNDLKNVCVVITRYFGGILLGAQRLLRTYLNSAKSVIEKSEIVEYIYSKKIELTVEYEDLSNIVNIIEKSGALIDKKEYSDKVKLEIYIPLDKVDEIEIKLKEYLKDEVKLKELSEEYKVIGN